ncbi:phosphoenolpyruvate mutase [Synergistes jonesii]|uniref:phosphoenolpyruvate mutase n=1 Tax=Synergistes jonesii TaxID=2754 RepID=UPI00248E8923|nr:phosphoenolpyruvate mutase [Synergistes jonesii]
MKALILNSGAGRRMGPLSGGRPKCMTEISPTESIIARQLRQLSECGVEEAVITTGPFAAALEGYCRALGLPLRLTFVHNPRWAETNYIYSIYCARERLRGEGILLMHGDLVFEESVLEEALAAKTSVMAVSSALPPPQKDFKAVIRGGRVARVGVDLFDGAVTAQPLYKLLEDDWETWLGGIAEFCEAGRTDCYAEEALNEAADRCRIMPLDFGGALCAEIDTPQDLAAVSARLKEIEERLVYMCFSTDVVHSGHIAIMRRARRLGRLVVGVLSDEAVASYKRFPLVPFEERRALFENIAGVSRVVEQKSLSYADILRELRPAVVVHGDDWREGAQRPIRAEVLAILAEQGGKLVEFPYTKDAKLDQLEARFREKLSLPDVRRARLRRLLSLKPLVTAIEAHNGITGLIAEKTVVCQEGRARQFDAMWLSSLCDSTAKGKPDIELVDMSSRLRTADEIMEVTTKPMILDGDTGGLVEHFVYNVRTLERMGVSAVIIEDKTGLKKNSLFGVEAKQTQDSPENFAAKIRAGKEAQKTRDFMIIARIESLILEKGVDDALLRARAYTGAGADGIMIHSRKKDPAEIFAFVEKFRALDKSTPIAVVPTSFSSVTEEEFARRGVNIVIYANQLTRSAFPAMQKAARTILERRRALEADELCMPIKDILTLIPEE